MRILDPGFWSLDYGRTQRRLMSISNQSPSRFRTRGSRRRGITLLEIIISIALIALLLGALLIFFQQTLRAREVAAARADRIRVAQRVLDQLAAELRSCVGMEQIGFPVEQRLTGDRRSISFLTTAMPPMESYEFRRESDDIPPGKHDLKQVGYRLWVDEEKETEDGEPVVGGIIRTEKRTLNQYIVEEDKSESVRSDLWSHELGYLEFRYFDGVEWDSKWDLTDGNSLPQLIQVTVGFAPVTKNELDDTDLTEYPLDQYPLGNDEVHDDRFSIIVKIPAADKFFSSRVQRLGKQLSEQLGVGGTP